ncbi:MAG: PQQ-binding-like beta-propeller repeat protein [Vicinamibacterales bacterium]
MAASRQRPFPRAALAAALLSLAVVASHAQGTRSVEWRHYGADLGSTRYSPLDQITAANFPTLELAWRFKTDNLGERPEFQYEGTPLMIGGVLYATGGSRRAVVALDAATGELLWVHGEREGRRAETAPRKLSGRGLSYWTDGTDTRVLYVTPGYQLVALDAKTGLRVPSFGKDGRVDLKLDDDQDIPPDGGDIGLHATPLVAGNVVVVGAAFGTGANPKSKIAVKGNIRGFDARTGKRLWIFHTIPRPGEFGNDTWRQDSWAFTGNTGVWAQMSADEALGLVYLPVETPTGDYFGGNRPGDNLFSESLVALDLETGERRWHYQFVHHGIWDMDLPCAPILVDVPMAGRTIKAIAQPSKQSFLYVLNRETGEPVWPIEERPVEKGTVPGEWYAPTQPFPTRPPAYERQSVSVDDLIDFTPELKAEALEFVKKYTMGGLFNPPVVSRREGPIAALTRSTSGTNWKGGSYDPDSHVVYVSSTGAITAYGLVPPPAGFSDMQYIAGNALTGPRLSGGAGSAAGGGNANLAAARAPSSPATRPAAAAADAGGGGGGSTNIQGLPLGKPPYGSLTAIDLTKGEILWSVPHGDTPTPIKNHPALKGLDLPRTGRPGTVGTLVTKTLLIAADPGVDVQANGERGAMLWAYDKATGERVGSIQMPAGEGGAPMTYMVNGRQYLVIAISSGTYSGELRAYRLPD